MIIPVWGEVYIDRWLTVSLASIKSEGNLPFLHSLCDVEIVIMTKQDDRNTLYSREKFVELTHDYNVKIIYIDDLFPKKAIHYGLPLTLSYARAIDDLGDSVTDTYVLLMNADFVLARNSLSTLYNRIIQGYTIITCPSIRVIEEDMRPIITDIFYKNNEVFSLSSREMMSLINNHLHGSVTARTLNVDSPVLCNHYHIMYWKISDDCLAARYFLLMPLCFKPERRLDKVFTQIDYGIIAELCPNGRFTVMADSDEFLLMELQELTTEGYFYHPAPRFASEAERLSHFAKIITQNAQEWVTATHMRSHGVTLFFHANDLPSDVEQKLIPFSNLMDDLRHQISPVSHIGHPHWLGAISGYREAIYTNGKATIPTLIDDFRNSIKIPLEKISPPNNEFYRRILRDIEKWLILGPVTKDLERLISLNHPHEQSAVIYAGLLQHFLPLPSQGATALCVPSSNFAPGDPGVEWVFPAELANNLGMHLTILSPWHLLPHKQQFQAICSQVLANCGTLTIGYIGSRLYSPDASNYRGDVLAQLQQFFNPEKFTVTIQTLDRNEWMLRWEFFEHTVPLTNIFHPKIPQPLHSFLSVIRATWRRWMHSPNTTEKQYPHLIAAVIHVDKRNTSTESPYPTHLKASA